MARHVGIRNHGPGRFSGRLIGDIASSVLILVGVSGFMVSMWTPAIDPKRSVPVLIAGVALHFLMDVFSVANDRAAQNQRTRDYLDRIQREHEETLHELDEGPFSDASLARLLDRWARENPGKHLAIKHVIERRCVLPCGCNPHAVATGKGHEADCTR